MGASPPTSESDRDLKFLLQADFQQDADLQGQAFSMFDVSARRVLDENSVSADGLIRFRKSLSTSDAASEVDLRLAKVSYMDPAFQISAGRFDLFQILTSNSFFGAYPIMGIHRWTELSQPSLFPSSSALATRRTPSPRDLPRWP